MVFIFLALSIVYAVPATVPAKERTTCETVLAFGGYSCQDYEVTTSDGYVLTVQRVGMNGRSPQPGKAIVLHHGLLDSSWTWVANMPDQNLATLAAQRGYDVWLANSRGRSIYGEKNTHLSSDSDAFWDFSWDQMAANDVPALIETVLANNGGSTLVWVGHSQGTTIGFAAFERPEIARSVSRFVALAPVSKVGHLSLEFFHYLADLPAGAIELVLGKKQALGLGDPIPAFLCKFDPSLCDDAICLLAGCDSKADYNSTQLPVLLSHFPDGTSVHNLLKYAQEVRSDKFDMFDYGTAGNLDHYGTPNPPPYNLSAVRVPTVFYSGSNDKLADPIDVAWTASQLGSTLMAWHKNDFGHGDFVWSIDAADEIYLPLLNSIDEMS